MVRSLQEMPKMVRNVWSLSEGELLLFLAPNQNWKQDQDKPLFVVCFLISNLASESLKKISNNNFENHLSTKGQLISIGLFGVFNFSKKNTPERVFGLQVRYRELDIFKEILGIFWKEFFGRNFFGRIFLGGILWEEFLHC